MRSDVLPGFSSHNSADCRLGNFKSLRQVALQNGATGIQLPDLTNSRISEFRRRELLTSALPFPIGHVTRVVGLRPKNQVRRLHTCRSVARVPNHETVINRAIEQLVRNTISDQNSIFPTHNPVARGIQARFPDPATIVWRRPRAMMSKGLRESAPMHAVLAQRIAMSLPALVVSVAPSGRRDSRAIASFDVAGRLLHVEPRIQVGPCPRSVTSTRGGFSMPTISVHTDNSVYRTGGDE